MLILPFFSNMTLIIFSALQGDQLYLPSQARLQLVMTMGPFLANEM